MTVQSLLQPDTLGTIPIVLFSVCNCAISKISHRNENIYILKVQISEIKEGPATIVLFIEVYLCQRVLSSGVPLYDLPPGCGEA